MLGRAVLLDADVLGIEDGRTTIVAEHRDGYERLGHLGK